jgi:hypothetical protein
MNCALPFEMNKMNERVISKSVLIYVGFKIQNEITSNWRLKKGQP